MDWNSQTIVTGLAFLILTDPEFCERVSPMREYIGRNLPDDLKWVFMRALDYFGKFKTPIGTSVILEELKKQKQRKAIPKILLEQILQLIERIEDSVGKGILPASGYMLEEVLTYAKTQAIREVIVQNAKMLEQGEVDEFVSKISHIIEQFASVTFQTGERLMDIQKRIQLRRSGNNPSNRVPMGIPDLDAFICGLGEGELGIIIGPSGAGKTAFLIQVSIAGLMAGRNVAYASLEMSPLQLLERFDANISNIPIKHLVKEEAKVKERVREFINKVKSHLDIKQFPSGLTRVEDIDNYLKVLKSEGITPGMLIVDYGELLGFRSNEAYEGQGENFIKLRGIGVKWKIPVWVASQSNRPAWSKRIIRPDDIAESFRKVHVADVVIGLCRTEEEKRTKQVRFYIGKCRFEVDGFEVGPYTTALERGRLIDFGVRPKPTRMLSAEDENIIETVDVPFVNEEDND